MADTKFITFSFPFTKEECEKIRRMMKFDGIESLAEFIDKVLSDYYYFIQTRPKSDVLVVNNADSHNIKPANTKLTMFSFTFTVEEYEKLNRMMELDKTASLCEFYNKALDEYDKCIQTRIKLGVSTANMHIYNRKLQN